MGSSFTSHGALTDGNRYYSLALATNGLQNGASDGIAVDLSGTVAEFWSYEGTFTAADGPAVGLTSVDVGAEEDPNTPTGSSLQRIDFGDSWVLIEGSSTRGAINNPEPTFAVLLLAGLSLVLRRRLVRR